MLIALEPLLQIQKIIRCAFLTVLIELHFQQSVCRKQRQGLSLISAYQRFEQLLPALFRSDFHGIEILRNACLDRRILKFFLQHAIYLLFHSRTEIPIAALIEHIPKDILIIITRQWHDGRIKNHTTALIDILVTSSHKPVLHFRHGLHKFLWAKGFPVHEINQQRLIISQDLVPHLLLQSVPLLPVTA